MFFRIAFIIAICFATLLLLGTGLLPAVAAPPGQFPTNSVRVISDPPPPDLPGQFSETTLLRPDLLDPDPFWRSPTFDDSGWPASYPVTRQPGWGQPVGNPPPTDFVWGGPPGPGPDGEGRFEIVDNPAPQFLFLRKNFCIPLNAALDSIAAAGPLALQAAASPGRASVYYNSSPIVTGLPGDESGASSNLDLTAPVGAARRIGRNTLAMRIRDDVTDASAGVAYDLTFNYNIDPDAIVLNSDPASPTTVNTPVTFRQINNGLSGDGPFTFDWDLGNGVTSTAAAPAVAYATPGLYTIVLTMTDRFGCPSAPVTINHEVVAQAQVRFSQATYTVVEDQGVAVITVVLETPSPLPVTVDYTTADGTATAGDDYTAVSGTLTFPPGVESQTFSIPIIADGLAEPDETVDLILSNPDNAVIIEPNPATLIITDMAPPTGGGDDDDDDDDDDDGDLVPPPPPPAAVAPPPSPTPTRFPVTLLPETGLGERPAESNAASPWSQSGTGRMLIFGLGGLLGTMAGYYIIRRPRRRDRDPVSRK